jgi:hypothetical protein
MDAKAEQKQREQLVHQKEEERFLRQFESEMDRIKDKGGHGEGFGGVRIANGSAFESRFAPRGPLAIPFSQDAAQLYHAHREPVDVRDGFDPVAAAHVRSRSDLHGIKVCYVLAVIASVR